MKEVDRVLAALNTRRQELPPLGFWSGFRAAFAAVVTGLLVFAIMVGPVALVCYTVYKIVQLVVS